MTTEMNNEYGDRFTAGVGGNGDSKSFGDSISWHLLYRPSARSSWRRLNGQRPYRRSFCC